jgi:hypothetical protein
VAYYKYSQYLRQNNDQAFDEIWDPGARATYSGIYRCEACGREITHIGGESLPPQNHHQHATAQGRIQWRLVASHQAD